MKKSEILRVARGLIERKTKHTLCSALIGVVSLTPGCHIQAGELRAWIKSMLDAHVYYEDWLLHYYKDFAEEHHIRNVNWTPNAEDKGMFEAVRPGRLAWMDWMIQYWETKEAEADSLYGFSLCA